MHDYFKIKFDLGDLILILLPEIVDMAFERNMGQNINNFLDMAIAIIKVL